MASPLSSGTEGKVSSLPREKPVLNGGVLSKMAAPKLVVRSAHALEKPPDKKSCKGANFFASYDVFYVIIHALENNMADGREVQKAK